MAIALDQTAQGSVAFSSNVGIVFPGNTTTGNLVVVFVGHQSGTVNSVTDSQSNTYTKILDRSGGLAEGSLWYAYNITGGTTPTVTVTISSSQRLHAIAKEFSGIENGSDPLDVFASAASTSTTNHSSGATATTAQNDELVVGMLTVGTYTGTITAGSGYGNLVNQNTQVSGKISAEDKVVSTTGTQTATFTSSGSASLGIAVATFKGLSSLPALEILVTPGVQQTGGVRIV